MIDTHSHILPDIDDGARDLQESLKMAEAAWAAGLREIIVTPHGGWVGCGFDRSHVAERAAELERTFHEAGFPFKLHPGMEVFIDPEVPSQLQCGAIATLNGGPYVLIELPRQQYPIYTDDIFFQLQLQGYRPILAHPERNEPIEQDLARLQKLVERGVLGQLDARSLTGYYGTRVREAARTMVARRLVHLIASDAHWSSQYHHLPQALEEASHLVGREAALAMVERWPAAVLHGDSVEVPEPLPAQPKKTWGFWR